jgi:hypothetical protein
MKLKLFLLSLAFAAACNANASTGPGNGDDTKKNDIAGGVVNADTRKPLGNVQVTAFVANKREKAVLTDAHGNYNFSDLKPGTYRLVFEKEGFRRVVKEKVVIRSDEGCQLNIEMDENDAFQIVPGLLFTDLE